MLIGEGGLDLTDMHIFRLEFRLLAIHLAINTYSLLESYFIKMRIDQTSQSTIHIIYTTKSPNRDLYPKP